MGEIQNAVLNMLGTVQGALQNKALVGAVTSGKKAAEETKKITEQTSEELKKEVPKAASTGAQQGLSQVKIEGARLEPNTATSKPIFNLKDMSGFRTTTNPDDAPTYEVAQNGLRIKTPIFDYFRMAQSLQQSSSQRDNRDQQDYIKKVVEEMLKNRNNETGGNQ